MNNLIGRHLGPYRILEQIGAGGMATVYKAYQPAMERDVAIKVIAAHFAEEEEFLERFRREAKAVAQLEHAHILPVHDYGEADGRPYLVMRYLEAGTLKDRMAEGSLSLSEINRVVGQVGSALDYAHRMGVIHRDVKPANVLLDAEGNAYLTDFGLAKMMAGSARLTGTGVGIGTPIYMSPEQGQAQPVDARSDVYSLGVMLYELTTGRAPYEAETPLAVVLKHIQEPLPLPSSVRPGVPERVERVILRAMAKEPEDRYQTAGEMVRALDGAVRAAEAAARTEPAIKQTTPVPGAVRAAPRARARRLWLPRWVGWAAGGAVALAIFFLILSRVPLRVQISGGQLEVVRVVEETATAVVEATGVPVSITAATPVPVSPADQSRVFAAPILAAIAARAPDFEDDFSDPGSGWPTDTDAEEDECGYEDDALFISAAQGRGANPGLWLSDFVLEVDAQFVSGEWGLWWVALRNSQGTPGQTSSGEYGVGFSPDGALHLWKNVAGAHVDLLDHPVYASSFKQGFETNHLTIVAQGPQIAVYVNGEPLWFAYDESVSEGAILLEVTNEADDTPLRVHFDNLKVWDISDLELPSAEAALAPSINPTDQRGRLVTCGEDLCVQTADGSSVPLGLSASYTQFSRYTWSPEGSQIAFSACLLGNEGYCEELYVADLDNGAVVRLPRQGEDHHPLVPAWSPNGEWIAYHDSGALSVVRPDGTDHREVVPHPYCPTNIAWSPDGGRLAWFAHWCDEEETSPAMLLVVNSDGSDMRLLWTRDDANPHGSDVAFSPDGTYLVVRFDDGSVCQVDPGCDPGPDGCDESSRTEIDDFPEHWLHTHWPQWEGEEVVVPTLAEQARAFAAPILAAIADRPPDYEDDFSDPGSGWLTGPYTEGPGFSGEAGYIEGEYFVRASEESEEGVQYCGSNPSTILPGDFVLEVDWRFVLGTDGDWQFQFRHYPDPRTGQGVMYLVRIDRDLNMGLGRYGIGEGEYNFGLGSVRLDSGARRVLVVAKGPRMAVYADGEPILYVEDDNYSDLELEDAADHFNLTVWSPRGTPVEARWDNFKIWDITDLELPSAAALPAPTPSPLERGEILEPCGNDLCISSYEGARIPIGLEETHTAFQGASWSPDGAHIVFGACLQKDSLSDPVFGCRQDLFTANRDGSEVTALVKDPDRHCQLPVWSPDGEWIAYEESCDLAIIRPDGTDKRVLVACSDITCAHFGIAWSPDSQRIAWVGGRCSLERPNIVNRVWVINRDGGQASLIFRSDDPQLEEQHIAWSPDGEAVAVTLENGISYLIGADCHDLPNGCDDSSRTEIDAIPRHWMHSYWPQWGGE